MTDDPAVPLPKHNTWTGAQLALFLEHVAGDRWMPLWHLAAATKMRRGELWGLRWEHGDLDAAVIAVEVSTTQVGRNRVTTTPESHERRKVAIDAHTVAMLRAWRTTQASERLVMGPAYLDAEGTVFTW